MTQATLATFKETFDGDFKHDSLHKTLYATDASVYRRIPIAVAFPKSEKGIQQLIDFAKKYKTSLIPRTAGTSLAGQCVGDGIVVDVSKYFTKIISFNKEQKTVTVQPGVIRDELNDYLKPHGLFFGPNTSTSNRCMIGGMVGNNSSGTTSIKYGITRDKVVALKTILSNGDKVYFGNCKEKDISEKIKLETLEGTIYKTVFNTLSNSEVVKEIRAQFPKPEIHRRNTGYAVDALLDAEMFEGDQDFNISKLLAGSEGTLAFSTEITLQLDALPPVHERMIVAHYESVGLCMKDVVVAMKHNLYSCEMLDDTILNCTKSNKKFEPYRFFVVGDPKAILLLEVKGVSVADVEQQTEALLMSLNASEFSYAVPVLKGAEIDMAMELRKAGLGLLGNMIGDKKAVACIEDTAVALPDLPNYINEFTTIMKKYGQDAVYYAHAGAGELHLRPILNLKASDGVAYFRKITTDVAHLVKKYKGSFSGEHGDGIVRGEFVSLLVGEKNYDLFKTIKTTFDPHNIFNPGKIVEAYPMDEALRYVPDALVKEIDTKFDFSDSQGLLRLAEKCNGSGDCRKTERSFGVMCPSYQATKNEKDSTRGRANVLRETLTNSDTINAFDSKDLKEVFDLCISCKACANECPSNVDMATAKTEFLYQYHKSNTPTLATKLFGFSSKYAKKASRFPRLANAILRGKLTSNIAKNFSGVHHNRSIPLYSIKTFDKYTQLSVSQNNVSEYDLVLFVDEFSNFQDTSLAKDTYELLIGLGYNIKVITGLDSARALMSKGFLDEAKIEVDKNISSLKNLVTVDAPLVGIEPSAILGFRDEYLRLAEDRKGAEHISRNTYLIEEFLASEMQKGNIKTEQFSEETKSIKVHVHCHQKALSNTKHTFDVLNFPKNYSPTIINAGCCGMAGSFGYEKQHYEISMKIGGQRLFPAIHKAAAHVIIAANGTSCRHQIKDGTNRDALHPVTILKQALKPVVTLQ
ncbi:probable oxidoreductase [unidentified eubacterium SCB49]|nr:probable oxidoreductase [unidentified eubacterium SCB49]